MNIRATEAGELVEIEREALRTLVQTHSQLSDIFLRPFILRRLLPLAQASTDGLRCVQINALQRTGWSNYGCKLLISCPLGSAVEHSLHTRGVSSSNLLAGTKSIK